MQYTPETAQSLRQCFMQTLAADPVPRRAAEELLRKAAEQPGFGFAVLQLLADAAQEIQVRQAAAVNFKNHIRTHWFSADADSSESEPEPEPEPGIIHSDEKQHIKAQMVSSMLSSPPLVQSQLSEALAIISKHDFPKQWGSLLPELVSSLQNSTDYSVINGILSTANSIFKKFRYSFKSNDLYIDLKYCLDNFAAPLLDVFLRTGRLISSNLGNAALLKPLFECQRLCCRIFYSLNFQELPEFFENHMNEWMGEFRVYLTTSYPAIEGDRDGIVDHVRAAVCENINLYMEKNEEEFQGFLQDFATAVWSLLMNVSTDASRDRLAITAIKFLTTVSRSVHHTLFSSVDVLRQICESIVLPNVMLREDDMELFEMNHVEYIRRDIEGSDLDTRRRIACELVKGLATHYREQVMGIVAAHIQNMQAKYSAKPAENWKDKDCAIYLVVALSTKQGIGACVTPELVNFEQFVLTMILPEIQSEQINEQPLLKADALKFLTNFRHQIPKPSFLNIMPHLIKFLVSESYVVHSYAANSIEKILLIKDDKQPRYTAVDISPFLQLLLSNLFNALQMPESQENSYVMKCLMRVVGTAELSGEAGIYCLNNLAQMLTAVCKNPKNPSFNHYIFETVAALIRRSCDKNADLILSYETSLFPVLQTILVDDVTEFVPYAFQLLSQLIEVHPIPLPAPYMQVFEILLLPEVWKKKGNVPALVRLLQAFLQKASQEVAQEGKLEKVFRIFVSLTVSSRTDHLGFFILNTVVENLSYNVFSSHVPTIWNVLFTRLQSSRTPKFVKSFIVFVSLFVVKHGHAIVSDSINAIQPNIFNTILEQFFVNDLKSITGALETKLCAVATSRLLCESPVLIADNSIALWGKLLNSVMSLLVRPEEERVVDEPDVPDIEDTAGYAPTFAQLYNAGRKEEDPVKEIEDPKQYLVSALARLSAQFPGKYPVIIQQSLDQANQAVLAQFCSLFGCAIA